MKTLKLMSLVLTICLLTSCNLFKRVETTSYKAQSSNKLEEVKEEKRIVINDVTTSEVQQKNIDLKTVLKGDRIFIDKDGNTIAEGNAELKKDLHDGSSGSKQTADKIVTVSDSKSDQKQELKQKTKEKESVSKPSITGAVSIAIGVVIIGVAIALYLGYYPKFKKKN